VAAAANVALWAAQKWAIHAVDAGRARAWLERIDQWLTERAERGRPGTPGSAARAGESR